MLSYHSILRSTPAKVSLSSPANRYHRLRKFAIMPDGSASSSSGPKTNSKAKQYELCFYVPSPIHPAAYQRAEELNVDVIHPQDPRSKTWWERTLSTV